LSSHLFGMASCLRLPFLRKEAFLCNIIIETFRLPRKRAIENHSCEKHHFVSFIVIIAQHGCSWDVNVKGVVEQLQSYCISVKSNEKPRNTSLQWGLPLHKNMKDARMLSRN